MIFDFKYDLFYRISYKDDFFTSNVEGYCFINKYINDNVDEICYKVGLKNYIKFYKENDIENVIKFFSMDKDIVLLDLDKEKTYRNVGFLNLK